MNDTTSPFVTPSIAHEQREFDGLGRRRIIHPDDVGKQNPKRVGYTRATTYISALEDLTALSKWRTRLTLEGLDQMGADFHTRMSDARFLLEEEGGGEEAAAKEYRKLVNELATEAFDLAGGHDAADYGTDLHSLIELHHLDRLTDERLAAAEAARPGILENLSAYVVAWNDFAAATGAEVLQQEILVVDDRLKVAGRTDAIVRARLAGDKRARRMIVDVKTSADINLGSLKFSQQLAMYSGSRLYDPTTGQRSPLRTRRDVAVLAWVPRGSARASFHIVQLKPGRDANVLCARVRHSRRKVPGLITEWSQIDG